MSRYLLAFLFNVFLKMKKKKKVAFALCYSDLTIVSFRQEFCFLLSNPSEVE